MCIRDRCYNNIEKGGDLQSVLRSCIAYVGKFYHAQRVLFFTKGEEEDELEEMMIWGMDSFCTVDSQEKKRENGWLEKVLELALPENSILICLLYTSRRSRAQYSYAESYN